MTCSFYLRPTRAGGAKDRGERQRLKCRPGGGERRAVAARIRPTIVFGRMRSTPRSTASRPGSYAGAPLQRCLALQRLRRVARGRVVMHDRRREVARAPRHPGLRRPHGWRARACSARDMRARRRCAGGARARATRSATLRRGSRGRPSPRRSSTAGSIRRSGDRIAARSARRRTGSADPTGTGAPRRLRRCSRDAIDRRRTRRPPGAPAAPTATPARRARRWRRESTAGACRRRRCRRRCRRGSRRPHRRAGRCGRRGTAARRRSAPGWCGRGDARRTARGARHGRWLLAHGNRVIG